VFLKKSTTDEQCLTSDSIRDESHLQRIGLKWQRSKGLTRAGASSCFNVPCSFFSLSYSHTSCYFSLL